MKAWRRDLFLVALVVFVLRVPFLWHPIQGDDLYYLAGGAHGLIEPLHPHHAKYMFQGRLVDMRGHPHPPLNAWLLTALLATFGEVREAKFHAAYLLLSLVAAFGAYAIARKYAVRPLLATLLFLAAPAFWVSGNSYESDLPLLAMWLAGTALFVYQRYALATVPLFLAGLAGYQAVVLTPILLILSRNWVALMPVIAVIAYQVVEKLTGGAFPVQVAAGYFNEYGLQRWEAKLRNAIALSGHLLFVASPLALVALFRKSDRRDTWLAAWAALFFVAALVLFFAGSARYLLPLALPVAILVANRLGARLLTAAIAFQFLLGGALAYTNYQHWQGYKDFVATHAAQIRAKRTWINGEWGLRYYAELLGGVPLTQGQRVQPGDLVLSSKLAFPIPYTTGGGTLVSLAEQPLTTTLPLRLIGLDAKSAWSTAALGLRPFDVTTQPVDIVRLDALFERTPELSYLPMAAPQAESQILGGLYHLEEGKYRWASQRAELLLKASTGAVEVSIYVPDASPAREFRLYLDGKLLATEKLAKPGLYTLRGDGSGSQLVIEADKSFLAPGDSRELSFILQGAGFTSAKN